MGYANGDEIMEESKSLFDCIDKWKPLAGGEVFKDETKERLDKIVFDSGEFVNWMYDQEENMTLSKTKVSMKGIRKFDKKGKEKFYLLIDQWWEKLEETITNDIKCKDLAELEMLLLIEKGNIEVAKKLFEERILFDGSRYWWKFSYEDKQVKFIEKTIPEVEIDAE